MTDALPRETPETDAAAAWWRQAVVYQIYPRAFADADGDGIGDIPGILSRVDYLAALGVDAVWLSPFYPSALADGGYDVADYRDVDPRLGTLDDFDAMVAALHERGIRVVVDIVPNHTSDQHEWFQEALAAGRGSAARERYIFREGKGEGGVEPPTDWVSVFGGPAWERVEDGQWYFHHFAKEQPDLNWDLREVRDDFLKTLRFWSDRGVDGFRIDVAEMLAKDFSDPLPSREELALIPIDGNHPLSDRDEVHEIYAEWRALFNSYDPPRTAVAEAWVASHRVPRYASPESLGQAFNFDLLKASFDAGEFRRIVSDNLALAAESGSSSTWVLSNHDVVRHPTRYGIPADPAGSTAEVQHGGEWLRAGGDEALLDRERGTRRARAATLFMLGLPGSAYLYQGEELGLHEVAEIPDADRQDPAFFRTTPEDRGFDGVGRDGCRVPLPWTREGSSFGFGAGGAHLPQPAWFGGSSVQAEDGVPGSTLELYREALRLRRELQGAEELTWAEGIDGGDVLAFERPGGWLTVANLGAEGTPLPAGELLLASGPLEAAADGSAVLPAGTTAWIRR